MTIKYYINMVYVDFKLADVNKTKSLEKMNSLKTSYLKQLIMQAYIKGYYLNRDICMDQLCLKLKQ